MSHFQRIGEVIVGATLFLRGEQLLDGLVCISCVSQLFVEGDRAILHGSGKGSLYAYVLVGTQVDDKRQLCALPLVSAFHPKERQKDTLLCCGGIIIVEGVKSFWLRDSASS